jgi:multicomponent Na+:H+ antiporter subunit B
VNTLIFRTVAPFLTALMVVFSVFVLLRGHNEPGGGFIGGLIAASALAIYGIACGVAPVRRALVLHPMAISAIGLLCSALSGLPSMAAGVPYLTALWVTPTVLGSELPLSTVLLFDVGVYLVVLGALGSILLGLEEREIDRDADRGEGG